MAQAPRNSAVSTPYAFGGGLDQTTASISVPGGRVIAGLNYESVTGGYKRVQGHERTDGRLPSSMKASRLNITGLVGGGYSNGQIITGATSGATAVVIQQLTDPVSGAISLAITNIVGVFINGETFSSGVRHAVVSGTVYTVANDQNNEGAQNYLRALIQKVPGSGPVRGGFVFNGSAYAVRDNVGATQGILYKATAAGWVAQSFGRRLYFRNGLVEVLEGQTLTGATSGATATVQRIIVSTGAWGAAIAADQAQGWFVLSNVVGVFLLNETLKVGATSVATNPDGGSIQLTLPPGGRYQFKVKNFYGATNRKRVYGVNGVGIAFEYDGGSVLVPIYTGTPTDTPTRLFDIANALGLCFPGGSVQISAPGSPCVFNAILGALEIGVGDDITDVIDTNDSAVVFFCKEKISTLTGRGVDTFTLDEITEEAGAQAWTAQRIGQIYAPLTAQSYGQTIYLDKRGLRNVSSAETFGDFRAGDISQLFDRFLEAKQRAGATPVASLRSKTKTQYRLYYSDGTGFSVYMGGKSPEMLPFETNGMQVYATFTGEMADGSEGLFGCAQDGYVYRFDSGMSFDGVTIRAFLMLPFNHLGSVGMNKRFHGVSLELDADVQTRIGVLAQFDYGDGQQPISGNQDFSTFNGNDFVVAGGGGDFIHASGGGVWDPAVWGQFYWSTSYQGMAEADIAGAGRNISVIIASPATQMEAPHTLRSYTIRWSARGPVKRTAD